ncbi:MAG TPA: holo-ACP synthase [Clostridiales bacterium]|nr:holo-ACP synthase [Clostridiales bacterium]
MIIGIGTDLIESSRVIKACSKSSFQEKIFTKDEIELCKEDKVKFADNFAVKESVSKMLGTGFTGIKPIEIEVLRDSKGKPYVNMYGACLKKSIELGIRKVFVTISNTKEFSMAFVVGEGGIDKCK